jgi:isoquinoline 1-oxidoreductase subunit beta
MAVAQKFSEGVSRRSLLTSGLAGGFLLAFHLPVRAVNEPVQPPDDTDGKFAPNAFIRIDRSGKTTLVMPQVEMGQGVLPFRRPEDTARIVEGLRLAGLPA